MFGASHCTIQKQSTNCSSDPFFSRWQSCFGGKLTEQSHIKYYYAIAGQNHPPTPSLTECCAILLLPYRMLRDRSGRGREIFSCSDFDPAVRGQNHCSFSDSPPSPRKHGGRWAGLGVGKILLARSIAFICNRKVLEKKG